MVMRRRSRASNRCSFTFSRKLWTSWKPELTTSPTQSPHPRHPQTHVSFTPLPFKTSLPIDPITIAVKAKAHTAYIRHGDKYGFDNTLETFEKLFNGFTSQYPVSREAPQHDRMGAIKKEKLREVEKAFGKLTNIFDIAREETLQEAYERVGVSEVMREKQMEMDEN
jgi:hypothetical protein